MKRLLLVRGHLLKTPQRTLFKQAVARESKLKYNKLGSSNLLVSEVCLGTMTFGEQNDEKSSFELLDYATAHGVNFIDTAEMYPVPPNEKSQGRTEEIIGNWMKARNNRKDVVIATKVAGYRTPSSYTTALNQRRIPPVDKKEARVDEQSIKAAVNASLKRLQTNYIDLLYIHWPDRYTAAFGMRQYNAKNYREHVSFEEQVKAIGDLIKEGKVKHWGLSNETTFGVCQFINACKALKVPFPCAIQNSYSLVWRQFESELAEACEPHHFNIGLCPWSPLAGGVLTGKYSHGKPPDSRFGQFETFQERFQLKRVMNVADKYAQIAKNNNLTPAQLALAWCKSRSFIPSTIIGATKIEQLKANIEAFSIVLSDKVIKEVEEVQLEHRDPVLLD